jgi:hypothetical protein
MCIGAQRSGEGTGQQQFHEAKAAHSPNIEYQRINQFQKQNLSPIQYKAGSQGVRNFFSRSVRSEKAVFRSVLR